MRAMSAPIRQNPPAAEVHEKSMNSNHHQLPNATKRRLRRKKIVPVEIDPFSLKITHHQHQYAVDTKIVSHGPFDERPSTAKSLSSRAFLRSAAKPPKPTVPPRAKSAAHGCEIVTLVSLLSPGASDSEREDYSNGTGDNSPNDKAIPSLRKVGKSGRNALAHVYSVFINHSAIFFFIFLLAFLRSFVPGWWEFGRRWSGNWFAIGAAKSIAGAISSEN